MYRFALRYPIYRVAGIIPLYEYRDPFDESEKPPLKPPETPWERVRALFQYTKDGYVSKEYVATVQLTGSTFVLGLFIGSFKGSVQAYDKFLTVNQTTRFVSAYEARRKLQDHCILEGIKTGVIYGTKCSAFVCIMGIAMIIITAYRGKEGILEYVLGAALAGTVVRSYMGITGAAVGGFVGALLGTVIGTIIWALCKLSGVSFRDSQEMLYQLKISRDRAQSDMAMDMQIEGYESKQLAGWLKSLKKKFEYTIDDRDMKYVVQPTVMDDTDEPSKENTANSVEHEDRISKDDMKKAIPHEEKSNR